MLVGLRTEAAGDPASGPPPDVKMAFRYKLGFTPGEVSSAGQGSQAESGSSSTPAGSANQSSPQAGEAVGLPQATASGTAVPRIYATHRDKETVSLRPRVTSQARWEWDFGDGTA